MLLRRWVVWCYNTSCEKLGDLACLGGFSCHHEMSVWLPTKCSKSLPRTQKNSNSSGRFLQVSSFAFITWNVLILPDTFSREAVILIRYPRSEFAVALTLSGLENKIIDLTAISILGVKILSIEVKIAFWILYSSMSTMLSISLTILSSKHLSEHWTFTELSLTVKLLPRILTVVS